MSSLVRCPLLVALVFAFAAGCGSTDDGDDSGSGGSQGPNGNGGTPPGGDGEPPELSGITAAHNAARAAVDPAAATPIPPLEWSPEVAAVAQAHASKCVFEHTRDGSYGENLYATSRDDAPEDVVASWTAERIDYDYGSNACSGTCGHYTQVVWAASRKLGCGVAQCTENSPIGGPWEFWVCNYDPPGNFIGQRPY